MKFSEFSIFCNKEKFFSILPWLCFGWLNFVISFDIWWQRENRKGWPGLNHGSGRRTSWNPFHFFLALFDLILFQFDYLAIAIKNKKWRKQFLWNSLNFNGIFSFEEEIFQVGQIWCEFLRKNKSLFWNQSLYCDKPASSYKFFFQFLTFMNEFSFYLKSLLIFLDLLGFFK